ncbi:MULTISPECIES: NAD-glutamate dehydrogenase [Rhodomicrobium]|uniref:NAD-glutamate dehydrogenase n=1 Tax=Rhodomicrobium TaxID=1068 RepID=UPI000B4A7AEF|nr:MULTISPECIES: NAD-glutamate dehydrogenase [Rhodomicrobium]
MNEINISAISQAVQQAVSASGPDGRLAAEFTSALFAGTGVDGDHAPPSELAQLAVNAFAFFTERPAGGHKLRAYDFDSDAALGPVTVIEAVNDDMPFLLSSLLAEIIDRGLTVRFVAHPIFNVTRDAAGVVTQLSAANGGDSGTDTESFLHIEIDPLDGDAARDDLLRKLAKILEDVRTVVADRGAMAERLQHTIDAYVAAPPPIAVDELAESLQFLRWLADGHFIFLGLREYAFSVGADGPQLEVKHDASMGLLRDPDLHVLRRTGAASEMSPIARELFSAPALLLIAKGNFLSPVQRRVHVDSIGIKLYSDDGKLTGELRIVGLFSATAYNASLSQVPFLRHKIEQVFRRLGNGPNSYSGRVLTNILETFPRDELFQISVDQLAEISDAILRLELMPRTRVFVRRDEFGRFASVLIYVMRERYTTDVRQKIVGLLEKSFDARLTEFTPVFTVGPLVRLHVVVWRDEGSIADVSEDALEAEVQGFVHTWRDELQTLIRRHYGRGTNGILGRFGEAFPPGYEDSNPPERALEDIDRIEKLSPELPVGIDFFRERRSPPNELQVTLYQLDEPISLSKRVPVLENLGFSVIAEQTFEIATKRDGKPITVFLHELRLETANGQPIDLPVHDARLEETFLAIWRGDAGNDQFNRLIVQAGLDWREAALMRAYASYLRQIGAPFGQVYLAQTLARHGGIVRDLVQLFTVLFDPARARSNEERRAESAPIIASIEGALENVSSLDEDRMIRRILNLIQSTIRTNFFRSPTPLVGQDTIALKIRSQNVDAMPAPKPFAEIFVTSPRFEGVHLRGGPIARGGLRWSDRPQDFRTEVLGLAKAQQVKNAIIVPQGAKGGFVPRNIPKTASRDEMMTEGVACYRSFIANLLSITDNLKDGAVVPPAQTIRIDGDDPYLVVAADKGTATFSDIANALSLEKGFWLGDAFASGGSAGYDHKKMGITARGAWEAVKRHFREMNIDIQTTPFRVIGVGDMSGDVFGNGMLLSRKIQLVAAFDHRDIFIDPAPDMEASFEERKRLFELPRSSWQDYNRSLISEGGGVFLRSAKSIPLSPQMQVLLGTTQKAASPAEIIRLLLKAKADLLWFGGIGTYVRASTETDEAVNDRANDAIRVTALDVGAKVIGEGANLGATQRGRIEFALAGGRINTDAIDNSAGVNTSDVEVNIKIALAAAMRGGRLTMADRDVILAEMTDDVAETVLRNNYLQTLAISLGESRGLADLGFQTRLMHALEQTELLDRAIEQLPSDAELAERRQKRQPLTRPELAVLLAYSKIALYFELIDSPVVDDPYLSRVLADYFPAPMRERFHDEIETHALRREIVATVLANAVINRGGSTFIVRLKEETGRDAEEIAYAVAAAIGVFRLTEFGKMIDALDGKIDGARQISLYLLVQDVLRRQTAWFLRQGNFQEGLSTLIERYQTGLDRLSGAIGDLFDEGMNARLAEAEERLVVEEVPQPLARRLALLGALTSAPDIVALAVKLDRSELSVGRVYFEASSFFRIDEIRAASEHLGQADHYSRLAVNSTLDAVASAQRAIVEKVFASAAEGREPSFAAWAEANQAAVERARRSLNDILNGSELTLAKLTVAVAHFRELAEH